VLHSVRLSVRLSKLERHRNFKSGGHMSLDTSNCGRKFEVKGSKVKVTGNDDINVVFVWIIFVDTRKWIDLRTFCCFVL